MAELVQYETSDKSIRREKIGLRYADAITYNPDRADDARCADLRAGFGGPQLVELGYGIGFTFGSRRWLKTLSAKQG